MSGKATCASEKVIKDKSSEKTWETDRELVVGTSLLTIDTTQVENKIIIEMSPIELMMMTAQKLMKEETIDKGVINHSLTLLHRFVPDCKIENEASPFSNLKVIT